MSWPSKVTASASGRSRRPAHTGQGSATMNPWTRLRRVSLLESAKVCST